MFLKITIKQTLNIYNVNKYLIINWEDDYAKLSTSWVGYNFEEMPTKNCN